MSTNVIVILLLSLAIILPLAITYPSISIIYRGDSFSMQAGNIVATLWLDNRVVTVLSTNSQPAEMSQVRRRQGDGSRREIPCPSSVAKYNAYMGGVDHNDQLRKYYHVTLKCRKCYRYIFWFLFEVSVTNSYILSKLCTDQEAASKSLLQFRLDLSKELIGDYCSRRRPGRGPSARAALPLRHFPVKQRANSLSGRSKCWYCTHVRRPARRRETLWYCVDCGRSLCHTGVADGSDCFLLHHQQITSS